MKVRNIIGLALAGLLCLFIIIPRHFNGQTATTHGVLVSWVAPTAVSGVTITGYAIWRAPESGTTCGTFSQVGTASGAATLSWNDPTSDLSVSASYCYEVQTLGTNSAGATQSAASPQATVTTPASWPANPSAPSSCTAKVQ
jgi:hypothetical protein